MSLKDILYISVDFLSVFNKDNWLLSSLLFLAELEA